MVNTEGEAGHELGALTQIVDAGDCRLSRCLPVKAVKSNCRFPSSPVPPDLSVWEPQAEVKCFSSVVCKSPL